MKSELRWIIAMWLIDWALSIAPKGKSKTALLLAIEPWLQSEVKAGRQ